MKTKLLRALAAVLLSVFAIGGAFALSVDQTRNQNKRQDEQQNKRQR